MAKTKMAKTKSARPTADPARLAGGKTKPVTRTADRSRTVNVPRWLPASALVICVGGALASGYLTYEHFTMSSELVCPNKGGLDCESVTSSEQSKLFGIPVAILGLVYFVGMCAIVIPAAWRASDARIRLLLNTARLAGSGGGAVYVLYLIYAELFLIGSVCVWCTVVHVLSFALFGVIAFGTAMMPMTGHPR